MPSQNYTVRTRQNGTGTQVCLPAKCPLGILWVVFLTGRSLDHLPQSDLKYTLKCRVLDPTPDLLAQRSKLELLSKVPHTLAFAFLSSFTLAWPSHFLPLTLPRCTHCRYTQKYAAHSKMLGSYLGWRSSFLWSSSTPYLPNLVKFLFLFKTQFLWGTFPVAASTSCVLLLWGLFGTSQLALHTYLCGSHLLWAQGHLASLIKCFSIKSNALKHF